MNNTMTDKETLKWIYQSALLDLELGIKWYKLLTSGKKIKHQWVEEDPNDQKITSQEV